MSTDVVNDGRATSRLSHDLTAWLTTVNRAGQPQSSPVWFLWDDGVLWLRSQPGAGKLRNLTEQPRVAFHLNDEQGGGVVTIEGVANVAERVPAEIDDRYFAKYAEPLTRDLNSTPERMKDSYSVVLTITPTRARVW
jgi:PPOX class probable F420-dependent enzyme